MADRTSIALDVETADRLHDLKKRGESYDDVIRRLLEKREGSDDE